MNRLKNIVVGVDFSAFSQVALTQAMRIAGWNRSNLYIIHVVDKYVVGDLRKELRRQEKDVLDDVRRTAGERINEMLKSTSSPDDNSPNLATDRADIELKMDVVIGTEFEEILKRLRDVQADLLILGSNGTSDPKTGLGKVATKCLRKAPCKTLIVREDQDIPFRSVVACIDFSKASQQVVEQAVRIAMQDSARLHLVHTFYPPWEKLHYKSPTSGSSPDFQKQYRDNLTAELEVYLQKHKEDIKSLDVQCRLIEIHQPTDGIIEYIEKTDSDLVVMATRGRKGIKSLLPGTQAQRILHHTPVSVLVVKPEDSEHKLAVNGYEKSMGALHRRNFMRGLAGAGLGLFGAAGLNGCAWAKTKHKKNRPNILLAIADDWSWPHASIAGDKVVKTPTFDMVARKGVLFKNAFVSAPSCTPSRSSILTGRWHWQLEEGSELWGTLPAKFDVYPDILERAGYHVGYTRKGWAPGRDEPGGRRCNPAGPKYKDFKQFLQARRANEPFCFWFGSKDPHRKYTWQSGINSGMKIEDVQVPPSLPDNTEVRTDICDYYWEIQRFDREVGEILKLLKENGELDNTLVVITGDNGLPFPRCKGNLYDLGTQVPLAVCWGRNIKGGRMVEDFASLADLAPTFLEIAGLKPNRNMTATSFLNVLRSRESGCVDPRRNRVFIGRERHAWVREGGVGYPMRAIRTRDYLYIRNFEPDRWPAGSPRPEPDNDPKEPFGDIDNSPTKTYLLEHRNEAGVKKLFELACGKRPAEELYDLKKDPGQLQNLAESIAYAQIKQKLAAELMVELRATKDPRILGQGDTFDTYPYYGQRRRK